MTKWNIRKFEQGDFDSTHVAILAGLVILALACCGCAGKTRTIDMAGMYASESGVLAIGEVEVMAAPKGEESATIKYTEDNAWLQPSMKKHNIKIMLTGSNSVEKVDGIVQHICEAFKTAAVPGSVGAASAASVPAQSEAAQ